LKNLFIIRHAKSDQSFFGNDFERPLNERGQSDASLMARRLLEIKIKIDLLVSSPAIRAKNTACLFAEILNIAKEDILFISALYHAPEAVFYEEVAGLPDSYEAVALFSHNPGITYFVNSLNTGIEVNNMPTCSIYAVSADITHWSGFAKATKTFLFFDYPKK